MGAWAFRPSWRRNLRGSWRRNLRGSSMQFQSHLWLCGLGTCHLNSVSLCYRNVQRVLWSSHNLGSLETRHEKRLALTFGTEYQVLGRRLLHLKPCCQSLLPAVLVHNRMFNGLYLPDTGSIIEPENSSKDFQMSSEEGETWPLAKNH